MTVEIEFNQHIAAAVAPVIVYMNRAHDGAVRPLIVQRLISKVDSELGTTQARIQLDIFAPTYEQAKELAVLAEGAFRTFDAADTFAVYRGNELETFDDLVGLHRVILDAMLRFEERPIFG